MVIAIVAAVVVMMFAAKSIGEFVDRHPTIKMLALAFLILVGCALVAEGWDFHLPRGYIYFAMAFSVAVEMLNLRVRARMARRAAPVHLRKAAPAAGARSEETPAGGAPRGPAPGGEAGEPQDPSDRDS
jgi:hypothetical protein